MTCVETHDLEPLWQNGTPAEIRFGERWYFVTVVEVRRGHVSCRLEVPAERVVGRKGLLQKAATVSYAKGEILEINIFSQNLRQLEPWHNGEE